MSKTWIITGGSCGIGKALCDLVRDKGHNVVTCARSFEPGDDNALCADVSQPVTAPFLIRHTLNLYGQIDVLVNNAGVYQRATVEDTDVHYWNDCIGTSLNGTFYMCKYVLPHMKERNSGTIINVSSYVAKFLPPERAAYNCAKLAVLGLTTTLAKELVDYDIAVRAFSPWKTATRMDADGAAKIQPEEVANQIYDLYERDGGGDFYIGRDEVKWLVEPS